MKKIKYFALLCITSLAVLAHSAQAAVWETLYQWDNMRGKNVIEHG